MTKLKKAYKNNYTNAKQVSKETLKRWRKEALKYLTENPEEGYYYSCSGNSFMVAIREEDGITIYQTDNGYKEYIYEVKKRK